jgi:hypothetical protein
MQRVAAMLEADADENTTRRARAEVRLEITGRTMTRTGTLDEVLETLREGKPQLREERRNITLPEKAAEVVRLQRIVLPMIRARRELEPWEHVWRE